MNNEIYNGYSKLLQKKAYSRYSTNDRLLIIKHYEETNDSAATISSKFFLPYSSVSSTIDNYNITKFYPKSFLSEEIKTIEPTGMIADVTKDY